MQNVFFSFNQTVDLIVAKICEATTGQPRTIVSIDVSDHGIYLFFFSLKSEPLSINMICHHYLHKSLNYRPKIEI